MNVIVQLTETAQPIQHYRVRNTYSKGGFYCVLTATDDLVKYPMKRLWRVTETMEAG